MANPRQLSFPPVLDERWRTASRAPWPANVPSRTQALEALRGRLITVVALPGARRLSQRLNTPERLSLAEEDASPLLRAATVMRWRLAAARDLLRHAGEDRDSVALRALLVEVWQTLDALRAGAPDEPELDLAMDCAGEKLQQEAISFTQAVKDAEPAPPPPAPRESRRLSATGGRVLRLVTRSPRAVGLALLLGVAAMGQVSARPRAPALTSDGALDSVPDALVLADPASGTRLVRSTRLGPETEAQREWLRRQELLGQRVTRLGPGSYLVAPGPSVLSRAERGEP